jgi:heat shock protein HslJ
VAAGLKAPLAAALLLAASGCASVPTARGDSYVAVGTEPFWSVSIARGRIVYRSPDEPIEARRLTSQTATAGGGRRYESADTIVEAMPGVCSAGMSDSLYAETVTVRIGGRILEGCGAELGDPDFLSGRRWAIVSIDGEAVAGEDYVLEFDRGRLSGRAGCNRLSGRYTLASDWSFTVSSIASTRMACPGPRIAHEAAVLRLLGAPITIQLGEGVLSFSGTGDTAIVLRLI